MKANTSENKLQSQRSHGMVQVGSMLKNNAGMAIDSIQQVNDYQDEDDIVAFEDFNYVNEQKSDRSKIDSRSFRHSRDLNSISKNTKSRHTRDRPISAITVKPVFKSKSIISITDQINASKKVNKLDLNTIAIESTSDF